MDKFVHADGDFCIKCRSLHMHADMVHMYVDLDAEFCISIYCSIKYT